MQFVTYVASQKDILTNVPHAPAVTLKSVPHFGSKGLSDAYMLPTWFTLTTTAARGLLRGP